MNNIASRLPVDKTAAMVTRAGVHFKPKMKASEHVTSPLPLPIWKGTHKSGFDLTGHKCGQMLVTGLSLNKRGRWVVKCVCGNYELRKAKSIRNPKNQGDKCRECLKIDYIIESRDIVRPHA